MLALIFTVIFGIGIAYFATQNTSALTLHIANYSWSGIPIYLVVLISLLFGLLFAWIFYLLNSISSSMTLRGKENDLKVAKKENIELTKRLHQLELENASRDPQDSLLDDNSL